MSGLQWEPPPVAHRVGQTNWAEVAAELRANPREWAVVASSEKDGSLRSQGSSLKRGSAQGWTAGAFEVVARRRDGLTRLYARYVGEPS